MNTRPIRILLLTRAELSTQAGFGNTFDNLFKGMPNVEVANIYCTSGKPNDNVCVQYFQITEKQLIKNLINNRTPVGQAIDKSAAHRANIDTLSLRESNIFDFARKHRFILFFWVRELIWSLGRWKSRSLTSFIDAFSPDLIFTPVYESIYMNNIGLFIKGHSNAPMIGFIVDDHYTLRQFSLSPFFWIDRLVRRIWVKKTIDTCDMLYVISNVQKDWLLEAFDRDCKVLFKGASFADLPRTKCDPHSMLKFVYTGGLGDKRYVSLGQIGKALDEINGKEQRAELHIYSQTPLSHEMNRTFNSAASIVFHGCVDYQETIQIQQEADVLVHVESIELKPRLATKHSFSTKIVDYFGAGKCIFAVGWARAASIDYLVQNDAAIVATSCEEIEQKLEIMINNKKMIEDYATKAWECGKRSHQISTIQKNLYNDLVSVAGAPPAKTKI